MLRNLEPEATSSESATARVRPLRYPLTKNPVHFRAIATITAIAMKQAVVIEKAMKPGAACAAQSVPDSIAEVRRHAAGPIVDRR